MAYDPYATLTAQQPIKIPQAPSSYLVQVNTVLKTEFTKSTNQLVFLENWVKDFCMREYGKYEPTRFAAFIYTVFVGQMNGGTLTGIQPEVPWYSQKYNPPTAAAEWQPVREATAADLQPPKDQEVKIENNIDTVKQELEEMKNTMREMMEYISGNITKPNSTPSTNNLTK